VVDAVHGGQLRGYAEIPDESRAAIEALGEGVMPRQLFGEESYFAITLDPGEHMQRYQGVVGLTGETITDALVEYFTQSQQVDVLFKLAVDRDADGHWAAGGIMVERLPPEEAGKGDGEPPEEDAEGWRYANAIAATVKSEELLDPLLDANSLLYRLYHEEGVWVQDGQPVNAGCRCSRERIHDLLMSMPITDRADTIVDGKASVHCQFCNTTQEFTPADLGLSVN
jgi:molecular chaperone Hsp33